MKLKIRNLFKRKEQESYSSQNVVPANFYPYLVDLNWIYSNPTVDSSVIMNRDKEIDRIYNCLLRQTRRNAILVGDHGVGKTATFQKLVSNVINGECPNELKNCHFVQLDVQQIIATIEEKAMAQRISEIMQFIFNSRNLILVIDQVHLTQVSLFLSNYFSAAISSSIVGVIGLTTQEEFNEFFQLNVKTRSRLEVIPIEEPKPKNIPSMVEKTVKRLAKRYRVKISRGMVEYIISISGAFNSELANPALTVDIVEKSMIYAKRIGENKVTKKHVNMNCNFDYELYNEMSDEDKKLTAYHEAGHFIVHKLSTHIKNIKTTAVSIVPGEYFLGINTWVWEREKQLTCDKQYFIDRIATYLAGRVAEMILLGNESHDLYNSGASSDLVHATNIARTIITRFGMVEGCSENMAFLGNYDFSDFSLLSDDDKKMINQESKKLIDKAFERAKDILNTNRDLLDRVASELLKNEILDEKSLDKICKEVMSARVKS